MSWFADPEVPVDAVVGNEAYRDNRWDRGHMVRPQDLGVDPALWREAYLYSVCAPQHTSLNRGLWLQLERLTSEAVASGNVQSLVIIAGPVFGKHALPGAPGMPDIPDAFFRVAFDPLTGRTAAFVVPNGPLGQIEFSGTGPDRSGLMKYAATVEGIERLTGLDILSEWSGTEFEATDASDISWLQTD